MTSKRAHVIISGHVQGVFFRTSTLAIANKLGITGWVKNKPGNTVEALFEGDKLSEILSWCSQGSPLSKVDHVTINYLNGDSHYTDFKIQ